MKDLFFPSQDSGDFMLRGSQKRTEAQEIVVALLFLALHRENETLWERRRIDWERISEAHCKVLKWNLHTQNKRKEVHVFILTGQQNIRVSPGRLLLISCFQQSAFCVIVSQAWTLLPIFNDMLICCNHDNRLPNMSGKFDQNHKVSPTLAKVLMLIQTTVFP